MEKVTTQSDFPFGDGRRVRAQFDAPEISSDGGAVLLRQADRRLGLIESIAAVLPDSRDPRYVTQPLEDLVRQRVLQICLGYEDCNDATTLRGDPVLKTCCDRDPLLDPDLGSQPTLSRLENTVGGKTCYRVGQVLLDSYIARHTKRPRCIVLDLDTTDDPTHGQQELSFFHGYYDERVYLPLLVFDQDGDLVTAVLQPGKPERGRVAAAILKRVIVRLRDRWPGVPILIRGDSEFASPKIYWLCRRLRADFLVGIGPNRRLKKLARQIEQRARREFRRTGQKVRIFTSASYRALKGWPRAYRVLIKAEHSSLGPNTRFVLTTLPGPAEDLYDRYVQRGESSENSIKDLKRALKADRLSCHRFWSNQFRLFLHGAAYVLLFELRHAARGTELENAQMDTVRLRLLKVAAQVTSTARRIWFHLTSSNPWQALWHLVARRLLDPQPFG